MLRQARPSIVISDTGAGDHAVLAAGDYPGSDVMIHKKDFLIHIKKLSSRSQSIDCTRDCSSPAVQRRSSSAVTAGSQRQSVSSRNSLPLSINTKSLERKKTGSLQKYSGSQSTSSIPRRVVKENTEKLETLRKHSDDNSDHGDHDLGPVTSILSFVDQSSPGDTRKQSLIHGVEEFQVQEKQVKNDSNNVVKNDSSNVVKKAVIKKKDGVATPDNSINKAAAAKTKPGGILKQSETTIKKPSETVSNNKTPGSRKTSSESSKTLPRVANIKKQPLKASSTAPLTPTSSSKTPVSRQLRATKSATAPVTPAAVKKPLTNQRSAGAASTNQRSAGAASTNQNTSSQETTSQPIRGGSKPSPQISQVKNVKKEPSYPKKVSSEYPSEIVFKNQEGLKFSSVNFFESEDEAGQTR